jgi:hypothetical protein
LISIPKLNRSHFNTWAKDPRFVHLFLKENEDIPKPLVSTQPSI